MGRKQSLMISQNPISCESESTSTFAEFWFGGRQGS